MALHKNIFLVLAITTAAMGYPASMCHTDSCRKHIDANVHEVSLLQSTMAIHPAKSTLEMFPDAPTNNQATSNPIEQDVVAELFDSGLKSEIQVGHTESEAVKELDSSGMELHAQKESQHLSSLFASLASEASANDTQNLFGSFQLCGQCSSFKRFGEAHDGGYLMCMDAFKDNKMRAAYSLGVEHHDQWSEDVIQMYGVIVNQFDCTVDSSACTGCRFFQKCIASADGENPGPKGKEYDWSLVQALNETSQADAPKGSLLMKIDIEGSEWPIFASESSDTLKKFGEIIVEFHHLSEEEKHAEYLKAVQTILGAGFKIAHLHGNNFEGMYTVDTKTIPNVLEVTFVTGSTRPGGCSSKQDFQESMDAPNNPSNPELPPADLAGSASQD